MLSLNFSESLYHFLSNLILLYLLKFSIEIYFASILKTAENLFVSKSRP